MLAGREGFSAILSFPLGRPIEKLGGTAAARLGLFKPDPSTPSPTSSLHRFPSPGMGSFPHAAIEPLSLDDDVSPGEKGAPGLATRPGVVSLNARRSTAPSPFQQRVNSMRVVASYVGAKTPRGLSQSKSKPVAPSQAPSSQTQQSVKAEQQSPLRPASSADKAVPVKEEPMDADASDGRGKDLSSAEGDSTAPGRAADSTESKDADMKEKAEAATEKGAASPAAESQEQVQPAATGEEAVSREEAGAELAGKKGEPGNGAGDTEMAAANAYTAEERNGSSQPAPAEGEAAVKDEPAQEATGAQEGSEEAQGKSTEGQEMETEAEEDDTGAAIKPEPSDGGGNPGDSQAEDAADEMACVPAESVSRERCVVQPLEMGKLREQCRFMSDSAETRVSASMLDTDSAGMHAMCAHDDASLMLSCYFHPAQRRQ